MSCMKKRVLFIMPSMFIGGAERSILGLLEAIDYTKYDVTLFLYRHEGEFMQFIPQQVHVLPEIDRYRTFDVPIKSLLLSRKWLFGAARLLSKAAIVMHTRVSGEKHGIWMSMQYTSRFLQPLLPPIPGEYDVGIMFLGVADTLIRKVNTLKKLAWCHTDYSTLFPDRKKDLETYGNVDYVVHVSPDCAKAMLNLYPQLSDKTMVLENVLATHFIKKQAEEGISDMNRDGSGHLLLSIGRFCEAKNFDNVPDICRRLRESGLNIKWYLIGYGGDEPLIRQRIAEAGMQEHVVILGKKSNPYPYIKACDLYVQPSRYEGKCVTVREAQMLGKPVVITDYATAPSQLEDGVDGVVVPMDNAGCAEGIAQLLRDPLRMEMLSRNCLARDYSNAAEVEKLYRLMEE